MLHAHYQNTLKQKTHCFLSCGLKQMEVKRYSRYFFPGTCTGSLSAEGLGAPTSTVQNQIPYATGSRLLIVFTHQPGSRAVIGCSLQGPHRRRRSDVHALSDGQEQLHREPSRDLCLQTRSGGNLGPESGWGRHFNICNSCNVSPLADICKL